MHGLKQPPFAGCSDDSPADRGAGSETSSSLEAHPRWEPQSDDSNGEDHPKHLVGIFASVTSEGVPQVTVPPVFERVMPARSLIALHPSLLGREVLVAFAGDREKEPVILGLLQPKACVCATSPVSALLESHHDKADEREVKLEASESIVLQCGEASVTLTRAGKILLRGAYLSSRSSGVNRIKGGSVQIN